MINFSTLNLKKLRDIKLPSIRKLNEFKTYRYKSLSREDVLAFFAKAKRAFSLNLTVKSGKVDTFICIDKDYTQQYYRESALPIVFASVHAGDTRDTDCYLLSPIHSLCYPFNMSCAKNIFDELASQLKGNDCNIGIQFIFKKQDSKWKDTAEEQYEAYLNGLQNPSDLSLIRKLQVKVNDIASNYIHIQDNYELPTFQTKIKETGYLWSFRIFISHISKEKRNKALNKIKLIMSQMDGNNSFIPDSIANKKQFMEYMQFQQFPLVMNHNQILTTSEMICLFSGESIEDVKEEVKVVQIEKAPTPIQSKVDSLFDLLKSGEQQKTVINEEELYKRISNVFKKLGITSRKLDFTKLETGATLHKATFKLSDGLKINKMEKETDNIEAELGCDGVNIGRGDSAGTASISFMRDKRQIVYLKDIVDSKAFNESIRDIELPVVLGEDEIGNPLIFALEKLVHMLIAGTTGSGKSLLITAIIILLSMMKSPSELRMFLIDPKIVEFSMFENLPHVDEIITEAEDANELLFKLTELMDMRYEEFKNHKVRDIASYNKKNPDKKMPRIVVAIDEFADLIMLNKEVQTPVIRLGQKARAAGIHIILCTQKPMAEVVPTLIRDNIPARIALLCTSPNAYRTCITRTPPKLLGKGDGVAEINGHMDLIRFQSPVVTLDDSELEQLVNDIAAYWGADVSKIELPDIPEPEDENLINLKRIIFETGETKISELQKRLGIRKEKVSELMKQLVDEKWVNEPSTRKSGYTVALNKEEMAKQLDL